MMRNLIIAFLVAGSFFSAFAQEPKLKKKKSKKADIVAPAPENNPNKNSEPLEQLAPVKRAVSESHSSDINNVSQSRNADLERELISKSKPVVSNRENGLIDWTNQYIEAKGESVIDNERFKNPAQARAMATRGATVVAQRNLLEIVQGVNVVGETTVQDMITISDIIHTRVEGMLKGAQMVGNPIEKNGMMEVVMRIPLYQSNGLAAAVHDQLPKLGKKYQDSEFSSSSSSQASLASNKDNSKSAGPEQELENIVFNLTGKKYDPSMFPLLMDENNKVLLDLSKYYDPKKGSFPKIMETSKQVFDQVGFKRGNEVIDIIQSHSGRFIVPDNVAKKVNWKKIGETAAKVGSFLLMLI
jgi:hypothetical protein